MHKAVVITDLTFGDAGKGSITDALVRCGADLVVRYNGGAQAAHTVVDEAGQCHIFHQFGSGTLVEGAETFLSRFMLVNPLALHYEEQELRHLGVTDAAERMHIDARSLVTTPYHMIANRLRELARGQNRYGSCGLGIGETAADELEFGERVIRYGDLRDETLLRRKLKWHRELKLRLSESLQLAFEEPEKGQARDLLDQLHSEDELEATLEVFAAMADRLHLAPDDFLTQRLQKLGSTIFEGAQGVLLDENWGFHPYTTWSTTTPANALQLIKETHSGAHTTVLGLTRAYQTRHGAGPFPTESAEVTQAIPEPHNPTNQWQGPFRAGWLDLALLRYAIEVSGRIDGLVMTCLDQLSLLSEVRIGTGYEVNGKVWCPDTDASSGLAGRENVGRMLQSAEVSYASANRDPLAYAGDIARRLGLPIFGTSCGPTAECKKFAF